MSDFQVENIEMNEISHNKSKKIDSKKITFWQKLTKSKIPTDGKERVINHIFFKFTFKKKKQEITKKKKSNPLFYNIYVLIYFYYFFFILLLFKRISLQINQRKI